MGKPLRHQKTSGRTLEAVGSQAVRGAAEKAPVAPMPLGLVLGWAAGQATDPYLPVLHLCGLMQHLCCSPASWATLSAHPVHPSRMQPGRWHLLLWVLANLALGLHRACPLSDASLCSSVHAVSFPGCAPYIDLLCPWATPTALLMFCASRASLSAVFLDSSLMQLVRIFEHFDLFFLKYQLSEAHIGLRKQVPFLNGFK